MKFYTRYRKQHGPSRSGKDYILVENHFIYREIEQECILGILEQQFNLEIKRVEYINTDKLLHFGERRGKRRNIQRSSWNQGVKVIL